jgi:hypothetical protein
MIYAHLLLAFNSLCFPSSNLVDKKGNVLHFSDLVFISLFYLDGFWVIVRVWPGAEEAPKTRESAAKSWPNGKRGALGESGEAGVRACCFSWYGRECTAAMVFM